MGRVNAFTLDGLDLWFYSNDHLPPHFHVRKPGHWEVRVFFLDCTEQILAYELRWKKKGRGPSSKDERRLRHQIVQHKGALFVEWSNKVQAERS